MFFSRKHYVHVSKKKPANNKSKVLHAISSTAFNEKLGRSKKRRSARKRRRNNGKKRLLKNQLADEKRKQRKSKGMGKKIIRD